MSASRDRARRALALVWAAACLLAKTVVALGVGGAIYSAIFGVFVLAFATLGLIACCIGPAYLLAWAIVWIAWRCVDPYVEPGWRLSRVCAAVLPALAIGAQIFIDARWRYVGDVGLVLGHFIAMTTLPRNPWPRVRVLRRRRCSNG